MNIYAKKGDLVRFTGSTDSQWAYGGHDNPNGLLTVGQIYEIDHTVVHDWQTEVHLKGFIDKDFNSVCFEDVEVIPKSDYDALEKEAVEFAKAWAEDYRITKRYSEAKLLSERAQAFLEKHKEGK